MANAIVGRTILPSLGGDKNSDSQSENALTSAGNDSDLLKSAGRADSAEVPQDPENDSSESRQTSEICRRRVKFPAGKKLQDYKIVYVGMEGKSRGTALVK